MKIKARKKNLRVRIEVLQLLRKTFHDAADCHTWLHTPHADLGGQTPNEVIDEGKGQIIVDMLPS
jgi:uncharacterized protein (DUF2384 family)